MSTRSTIGIVNTDGTVTSIYCHSNGYIEGVGSILEKYYDEENTYRLMALGDLSTLGRTPVAYNQTDSENMYKLDDPHAKCRSYYGWRREYHPAVTDDDITTYTELVGVDSDIEYSYLYTREHGWLVSGKETGYEYKPVCNMLAKRIAGIMHAVELLNASC